MYRALQLDPSENHQQSLTEAHINRGNHESPEDRADPHIRRFAIEHDERQG